ncbi:aprataxin and PNK-like factor [Uloborus diversus]|uniref:aprataxin and PNK-like factor n=1 Tax=Uloborus diversus TaxID=327109 RepID=UPI00240A607B|nr:aprataxin and PNK-like factor [Uloborus diversus]
MTKITLKPLDDGQKAVDIPVGKTTIGRGPFLGCTDKKVSRNHAVLEVTNKGEVFLTPTHVNPCFYQPTADSPGQILKKDTPHKLENGDSFSLLPRAFRYQLIVVGDSAIEKNPDQNDLNKQCGKTNGSAGDESECMLNERNKDSAKCNSNEELNSDATVTEKAFTKEDELLANIDKSYSKEENTFSKKISEITSENKTQFCSEDKKINEEEEECSESEKSPSKENSSSEAPVNEKKGSNESVQDAKEDSCEDDVVAESKCSTQEENTELPKSESVSESEKNAEEEKPKSFNEKITEENESTLGNDAFLKEKTENEESLPEADKDSKSAQDATEIKRIDHVGESNGDGNPDNESSKETEEGNDSKNRDLPNWISSDTMPPPTKGARKKTQATKQPPKEKPPPKRKAATEDSEPKPKGRRRAQKLDFDDGGEGNSQRQVAGRTSSRTNRQTRQGLSLEDFIVSDDEEWQSDRSEPKQRRKKRGSRRGDDSGSDWEIEHKRTKKPTHKFGSGSESGSDWGIQKKKKGPKGRRRKTKLSASEVLSEDEAEEAEEPASESAKGEKIPCVYGKKCYRRNPNHVGQFSHPGDSDNVSEPEATEKNEKNDKNDKSDANSGSEVESNKKECPYGANCFRLYA